MIVFADAAFEHVLLACLLHKLAITTLFVAVH